MFDRSFGTLALTAVLAFGGVAHAITFETETPFNEVAFDKAQAAGSPILVHITASWCSICGVQQKILNELRRQEQFKPLLVFNVDFDSQKDLVRKFRSTAQSTMIVYKGGTEVGHFSGDTRTKAIALFLSRAF